MAQGNLQAVPVVASPVRSLPLNAVQWGVLLIVLFTAVNMLRTETAERKQELSPKTSTR
jgi:hypothetical protein